MRVIGRVLWALMGVGGAVVIALFLRRTQAARLEAVLSRVAWWLPALFMFEGGRIFLEALGTRSLYGRYAQSMPAWSLARAHVIGYGLAFYMPAGRTTAEVAKAGLLARHATGARAGAVAAANQSLALLGMAIAAGACAAVALSTPGARRLGGALVVLALVTGSLAVLIRLATLRLKMTWLERLAPRLAPLAREAQNEIPQAVPLFPLGMFVGTRVLQLASTALLLWVVGGAITARSVFLVAGVNLVGASLGDMVPGQLGTTDASFAVWAPLMGLSLENALAIALAIHVVQLSWLAIGLGTEVAVWAKGSLAAARSRARSLM